MAKRALLLINTNSRRGHERYDSILALLRQRNFELVEENAPDAKSAKRIMLAQRGNVECVIVGGGDGTLISMMDGLIESKLPMGILPLGTFNDLAKTLEVPVDLREACDIIAGGEQLQLDVGWVNGKHFINEASVGLSTHIARRQTTEVKRRFGFLAIVGTTLATLRYSRPFHAHIQYDGKQEGFRTVQLTVANSHHFGGFITNKDAAIDDGFLDLYSLEFRHWREVVPMLGKLMKQEMSGAQGVRSRRATEFVVRTTRPRDVFADGEHATQTPATFKVLPKAITVFAPPRADTRPATK
ncbi:MAG: lipid kinase [Candidatus Eremiobacteraeota bacterium]|nr:lipid kinase [Candidatus Eremiobacteraeota bacterium]